MSLMSDLSAIVGEKNVLTGDELAPYLTDWRNMATGAAQCAVRPGSTEEVAAVVKACASAGAPIVTQGGNTSLVGGATPDASGQSIVLLTSRLNKVREIDADNATITVEAGMILQNLQQTARDAGFLFPLSLAAEGSCTIGGNLATNAGGTQVLRYGNMRELTLGLEVVCADGEIWNGLRGLRKDNTGYDLRDLFVGSEGTLGIITAATLKLFPQPAAKCTAMLALSSVENAVAVLRRARKAFDTALTGYELMAGVCIDMVHRCFPQQKPPFAARPAWYALLETSDSEGEEHARAMFEAMLGESFEAGEIEDAVIAENIGQSKDLWHLRESITLAQAQAVKSIKHDISVPVSRMAEFIATTDAACQERFPGLLNMTFGHLGDGNLHYNVGTSERFTAEDMARDYDAIYNLVHDAAHAFQGSISAEHGIGAFKVDELPRYKAPRELDLMGRVKAAFDPQGLLNPGKMLR